MIILVLCGITIKKGSYNIGLIVILLGMIFMIGSSSLPVTKKDELKHNS